MEIIILIIVVLIILFSYSSTKFGKRMSDIEIVNYQINSESDLINYRDHLMHEIIKKHPNISDEDKVKVVIECIRDAHIGQNKKYLDGFNSSYQYVFQSYLELIKEMQKKN